MIQLDSASAAGLDQCECNDLLDLGRHRLAQRIIAVAHAKVLVGERRDGDVPSLAAGQVSCLVDPGAIDLVRVDAVL